MLFRKLSGGSGSVSVDDFDYEVVTDASGSASGSLAVNYSDGDLLVFSVLTEDGGARQIFDATLDGRVPYEAVWSGSNTRSSNIYYLTADNSGSTVDYTIRGGSSFKYIAAVTVLSSSGSFLIQLADAGLAAGDAAVDLSIPQGGAVVAGANTDDHLWPGAWSGVDQDITVTLGGGSLGESASLASRGDIISSPSYSVSASDSLGETVAAGFEATASIGDLSVTYTDEDSGTAVGSQVFLDMSVGVADVRRQVYAVVLVSTTDEPATINSVTIGGSTALKIVSSDDTSRNVGIYRAYLPTGTLADVGVNISLGDGTASIRVALYRVINGEVVATEEDSTDPISYSLSSTADGAVIAGLVCRDATTFSVSGVSVDTSGSNYWAGSGSTSGASVTIESNANAFPRSVAVTLTKGPT